MGGAGGGVRVMTGGRPAPLAGSGSGHHPVYLEADAPRVRCPQHGVTVSAVPWARHGSRFTTGFENTTAWLAAHVALSTLAILLRVTWRSVSAIVIRVVAELAGRTDRLAGCAGSGSTRSLTVMQVIVSRVLRGFFDGSW